MFMPAGLFAPTPFDDLIGDVGVRVAWRRSHACPCRGGATTAPSSGPNGNSAPAGMPNPGCLTCDGLGMYWDNPGPTFKALITMANDAGMGVNDKVGQFVAGEPMLTLSNQQDAASWAGASSYDQVIEIDAVSRYETILKVGVLEKVPFQQNLSIAISGAVTTWDPVAKQVVSVSGPSVIGLDDGTLLGVDSNPVSLIAGAPNSGPFYTVNGSTVTLNGAKKGTPYVVTFYAAPTYILLRPAGGLPHARPFVGTATPFPRRFHLQMMDMWLRNNTQQGGLVTP